MPGSKGIPSVDLICSVAGHKTSPVLFLQISGVKHKRREELFVIFAAEFLQRGDCVFGSGFDLYRADVVSVCDDWLPDKKINLHPLFCISFEYDE